MSAPEEDQAKGVRSASTKQFWMAVSWVILFLFSAAVIFLMLFIVPKFEQIFVDIAPGKPLPETTIFIFRFRIGLAMVALAWPIVAVLLQKLKKPYAILWINLGIIGFLLGTGITIIALFMPMDGPITGMSDAGK